MPKKEVTNQPCQVKTLHFCQRLLVQDQLDVRAMANIFGDGRRVAGVEEETGLPAIRSFRTFKMHFLKKIKIKITKKSFIIYIFLEKINYTIIYKWF
jgi:hypothetical protein